MTHFRPWNSPIRELFTNLKRLPKPWYPGPQNLLNTRGFG